MGGVTKRGTQLRSFVRNTLNVVTVVRVTCGWRCTLQMVQPLTMSRQCRILELTCVPTATQWRKSVEKLAWRKPTLLRCRNLETFNTDASPQSRAIQSYGGNEIAVWPQYFLASQNRKAAHRPFSESLLEKATGYPTIIFVTRIERGCSGNCWPDQDFDDFASSAVHPLWQGFSASY